MAKKKTSSRRRARPVSKKKNPMNKNMVIIAVLAIVIIIAVAGFIIFSGEGNDTNKSNGSNDDGEDNNGNPIAIIDVSGAVEGIIKAELYQDKVPITASNFINHANDGYYDGVIFHRVIRDFMIQGGDPTGTGAGGHAARYHEGYGNPDNPDSWVIPDEFHDDLKHDSVGILSMANAGPDTGGSQFFITVKKTPWLDGKHAVFGKVTEGMDIVNTISELDPQNTDDNNKPLDEVIINSITIEE